MKRYAIIDLGTNTFHLLIVDHAGNGFEEVYRKRIFVNLAEEKIDYINEEIQQRLFKAIALFKSKLNQYQVTTCSIVGTSALREASNGNTILDKIYNDYGIKVELINGEREANLIYKGVDLSLNMQEDNFLIMDIGGGSIEFIIVENGKKTWSASYQIGITILYHLLGNPDPMTGSLYDELKNLLSISLSPLFKTLKSIKINSLIGASGSFDVIESLMTEKEIIDKCIRIKRNNQYYQILDSIMHSTNDERRLMHAIPPSRKKLIPIALFLIEYIMESLNTQNLIISPYALKEGVLSELIQS